MCFDVNLFRNVLRVRPLPAFKWEIVYVSDGESNLDSGIMEEHTFWETTQDSSALGFSILTITNDWTRRAGEERRRPWVWVVLEANGVNVSRRKELPVCRVRWGLRIALWVRMWMSLVTKTEQFGARGWWIFGTRGLSKAMYGEKLQTPRVDNSSFCKCKFPVNLGNFCIKNFKNVLQFFMKGILSFLKWVGKTFSLGVFNT